MYDTPPRLLRQNPSPAPSETATDRGDLASSGSAEINRVGEMLMRMMQAMSGDMQQMNNKIDTNTNKMETNTIRMENKMDGNTKKMEEMRGQMQKMGHGLQAGIMAISCSETRTARKKMATPRAGASELGGSAMAVRPAVEAQQTNKPVGEDGPI